MPEEAKPDEHPGRDLSPWPAGPSALGELRGGADPDLTYSKVRTHRHMPGTEKGLTMKHIAGKALGAAGVLAVIVALIAGRDDIRRFRRMRSI